MKKAIVIIFLILISGYLKAQSLCLKYTSHAPISLTGQSNMTISGDSIIVGTGQGILLTNCHDIRITKCRFVNGSSTNGASGQGVAILETNCYNITVDSCFVTEVAAGVYANNCPNGGIVVKYNQFRNMKGPFPRADAVQFNRVGTVSVQNYIGYNKIQEIPGQSAPEDNINLYLSLGTASMPILVEYNEILGGGPSTTGSGITVGDNDKSTTVVGYQTIQYNTVVNPGAQGIQSAGGTHIVIQGNKIYSQHYSWSGGGIISANFSGLPSNNNTITGNYITYFGSGGYERDTAYKSPNNNTKPTGWSSNFVRSSVANIGMLPNPLWGTCALPAVFTYPAYTYAFTYGTVITPLIPFVSGGSISSYSVSPSLPGGLSLNTSTGVITGTPTNVYSSATYTVTGTSTGGTSTFPLAISVGQKNLSITAVNLDKRVGQVNPTLRVAYSDFAPGDSSASLDTQPTISTTAVTGSPAGSYPITVTGATSTKYAITFFNGTLTVSNGIIVNGILRVGF